LVMQVQPCEFKVALIRPHLRARDRRKASEAKPRAERPQRHHGSRNVLPAQVQHNLRLDLRKVLAMQQQAKALEVQNICTQAAVAAKAEREIKAAVRRRPATAGQVDHRAMQFAGSGRVHVSGNLPQTLCNTPMRAPIRPQSATARRTFFAESAKSTSVAVNGRPRRPQSAGARLQTRGCPLPGSLLQAVEKSLTWEQCAALLSPRVVLARQEAGLPPGLNDVTAAAPAKAETEADLGSRFPFSYLSSSWKPVVAAAESAALKRAEPPSRNRARPSSAPADGRRLVESTRRLVEMAPQPARGSSPAARSIFRRAQPQCHSACGGHHVVTAVRPSSAGGNFDALRCQRQTRPAELNLQPWSTPDRPPAGSTRRRPQSAPARRRSDDTSFGGGNEHFSPDSVGQAVVDTSSGCLPSRHKGGRVPVPTSGGFVAARRAAAKAQRCRAVPPR